MAIEEERIVYRRITIDDAFALVDCRIKFLNDIDPGIKKKRDLYPTVERARLLNELIKEPELSGLKYLHLHASRDGKGICRRAGFVEFSEPELVLRLDGK